MCRVIGNCSCPLILEFTFNRTVSTESMKEQSGGFLGLNIFGENKEKFITNLVMDSIKDGQLDIAAYIIASSIKYKVCPDMDVVCPITKCTLLHHLVKHANENDNIRTALELVLEKCDACDAINRQNADGDTVGHFALKYGMDHILCDLVSKGLDVSIKNNEGTYIKGVEQPVKKQNRKKYTDSIIEIEQDVEVSVRDNDTISNLLNIFKKNALEQHERDNKVLNTEDKLDAIVKFFNQPEEDELTIGFRRSDGTEVEPEPEPEREQNNLPEVKQINTLPTVFAVGGGSEKYKSRVSGVRELYTDKGLNNLSMTSVTNTDLDSQ